MLLASLHCGCCCHKVIYLQYFGGLTWHGRLVDLQPLAIRHYISFNPVKAQPDNSRRIWKLSKLDNKELPGLDEFGIRRSWHTESFSDSWKNDACSNFYLLLSSPFLFTFHWETYNKEIYFTAIPFLYLVSLKCIFEVSNSVERCSWTT